MSDERTREIQDLVKKAYGDIARNSGAAGGGCGCGCGSDSTDYARLLGYSEEELAAAPPEANLSLGCGNPTAIAGLKPGEVVLDLGSGAGFDCFLAAGRVGPEGRVIGVDMTPEMIAKAQENAAASGVTNVEFRQGEIEQLPVEDASVDVVISNCVINLSADKPRVFRELARVLRPGGRIAVSDIALFKELPEALAMSVAAYVGCVAGAITIEQYEAGVRATGLSDVEVAVKGMSSCLFEDSGDPVARDILANVPSGEDLEDYVASVYVTARK